MRATARRFGWSSVRCTTSTVSDFLVEDVPCSAEEWSQGGLVSREGDLPAVVMRSEGVLRAEFFARSGRLHRVGGPAVIEYGPDGRVTNREFFRKGLRHSLDGPAVIRGEGHELVEIFYVLGGWALEEDDFGRAIGAETKRNPRLFSVLLTESRYGVLLDEGGSASAVAEALAAGVRTVEGVRSVLEGSPVEWVVSFESGSDR